MNCFGQQDKNPYLWSMVNDNEPDNILSKLSRLMLSYNMAEGFGLQEHQKAIINKIRGVLNVNVELPQIYSFGEENQPRVLPTIWNSLKRAKTSLTSMSETRFALLSAIR